MNTLKGCNPQHKASPCVQKNTRVTEALKGRNPKST